MLTHEKNILFQQNRPLVLPSSPSKEVVSLVDAEDTGDSSSISSSRSSSSSKRTKRSRIESPLRGSKFISEESVLGCLKEDIDLSVQERNFDLKKNRRELDMRIYVTASFNRR